MSKRTFKSKIAVAMLASMILTLCSACGQQTENTTTEDASMDATQAYETFIQEEKEDGSKEEIYAAITTLDDGSQVLLITDEIMDGMNQSISAGLYSYSNGQVTKICDMESSSGAYPIGSVDGKYLVTGSHHSLERYLVSEDSANVEKVDGLAMEEGNCKMTTYTVANGEISNSEEKEISAEEANEFADPIYEAWEPIEFTTY